MRQTPPPIPAAIPGARTATRRRLCLLTGLAALMPLAMAGERPGMEVQAERIGELIHVQAQAVVQAPLSIVWATLTDYERLPEFIPGIETSRVLARDGHRITVAQTGQARFLFLSLPIEVTLVSTEHPPHVASPGACAIWTDATRPRRCRDAGCACAGPAACRPKPSCRR